MIIKGLEMPTEEITITIAPNGWVYKVISKGCAVLLDGVTAENEKKVLYLCDRRDPACRYCDDICNATKNIEHAVGFVRQFRDEYVDERIRRAGGLGGPGRGGFISKYDLKTGLFSAPEELR